jgi:hypothetical protein
MNVNSSPTSSAVNHLHLPPVFQVRDVAMQPSPTARVSFGARIMRALLCSGRSVVNNVAERSPSAAQHPASVQSDASLRGRFAALRDNAPKPFVFDSKECPSSPINDAHNLLCGFGGEYPSGRLQSKIPTDAVHALRLN